MELFFYSEMQSPQRMDIGAAFLPLSLGRVNAALGPSHTCFQEWSENDLALPFLSSKIAV